MNGMNDLHTILLKLKQGDRRALAKAMTLVTSWRDEDRVMAEALFARLASERKPQKQSLKLGITGPPGAGKSSFIETLGLKYIEFGHQVGVLAIDPSSPIAGGSILGDKTRMELLARSPHSFIRPTPSSGVMGGVGAKAAAQILLMEQAGYDIILIETVGVGQSEVAIKDIADLVLLILAPAAGDELQMMKKGIMEIGDIIIVNKCDGELKPLAEATLQMLKSSQRLPSLTRKSETAFVNSVSALTHQGFSELLETIQLAQNQLQQSDELTLRRQRQKQNWWNQELQTRLLALAEEPELQASRTELERKIAQGEIFPPVAVSQFLREAFELWQSRH